MGMGTIVMGVGLAACGSETTKTCTLIGCQDEFVALVRSADGFLPSGMHRVELLVDGVTLMCTFKVPLEAAPGGGLVQPTCPAGLSVTVMFTVEDVEIITVPGTPGQVHAWQYVDDRAILDVAAAPTYQENAPNGPGCGPICRQASVSWTLQ